MRTHVKKNSIRGSKGESWHKKNSIRGIKVESWYDERACNWQAFIKGTGTSSAPCNREDAIAAVIALHERRKCPAIS